MSTLTSFSALRPSPTVAERIVKDFTREKGYNMKTGACLPFVFRSRRLEGHTNRRFVVAIRQKKRLDLRRPRAIGRGQSIPGKTNTPVSSLLSRIGRRGVQKRDAEGGHGALLVGGGDGEGDDACRSFEKYVMDFILEDGRVGDLRDVEELLHCWSNLLCPVLTDIVATFYIEACKELFTTD